MAPSADVAGPIGRPPRSIAQASVLLWAAAACNIVVAYLSFAAMPAVDRRLRIGYDALPDEVAAAHRILMVWRIISIVIAVTLATLGVVVRRSGRSIRTISIAVAIIGLIITCCSCALAADVGGESAMSGPDTGRGDGDIVAASFPAAYPLSIAMLQAATLGLVLAALIILCLRDSAHYYRYGSEAPVTPHARYRGEHA